MAAGVDVRQATSTMAMMKKTYGMLGPSHGSSAQRMPVAAARVRAAKPAYFHETRQGKSSIHRPGRRSPNLAQRAGAVHQRASPLGGPPDGLGIDVEEVVALPAAGLVERLADLVGLRGLELQARRAVFARVILGGYHQCP